MKLRYFDVERFGFWDSMRLGDLSEELTVVYGPNGSGKTTLMQFVRAVCYGSPGAGSHRRLPVLHPGPQGGRLGVTASGRELVVTRLWDQTSDPDKIVLTAPDGSIVTSHSLTSLLGHVPEDVFESVFTVGYREAEDLGVIVSEALADEGQVAVSGELAQVEAAIAELDRAVDQLDDLRQRRQRMAGEIGSLESQSTQPGNDLERLRRLIADVEARSSELRVKIARLKDEIARCKSEPAASDEDSYSAQLQELERRISRYRSWQREMEQQLAETRHLLHQNVMREAGAATSCAAAQLPPMRKSMTAVEAMVAALESRFAAGDPVQNGARASVQAEVRQLRGQVHKLCDQLSQHQVLHEGRQLEAEAAQLERLHGDTGDQIQLLEQRRAALLAAYSQNAHSGMLTYVHKQHAQCESQEHAAWLGQAVSAVPAANVDELIAQHDRLAELLSEEQDRLAELNVERANLEKLLTSSEVALRLEALRFDLNVVEEEIRSANDARVVRETTRVLLDELRAEYESRRCSLVLSEAAEFLSRLSGEDVALRPNDDRTSIVLHRSGGEARVLSALSHGERDQVALALRLALVRAYGRKGARLPLILDDVFITSDSAIAGATARLLRDFASENQVLFFTCHSHIADMFRQLGVAVRDLPLQNTATSRPKPVQPQPRSIVSKVIAAPREPMPLARKEPVVTAPWMNPSESLVVKAFRNEADELTDIHVETDLDQRGNWIFYTELSTPISELFGIDGEHSGGLADCGVRTVEDLIAMVPTAAATQLANLGLSAEQVQSWQAQALLSCRVPMLHRRDAALLVRSGITSPEQLAETHPESVYELVAAYLTTPDGNRFVKPSGPFDRQTAINWVRWAAHSRTLWHSRESRGERRGETSQQRIQKAVDAYRSRVTTSPNQSGPATSETGSRTLSRTDSAAAGGPDRSGGSRSRRSGAQRVSSRSASSLKRKRSSRSGSERSEGERSSSSEVRSQRSRQSSESTPTEEVRTLKFYLKRDAPVEDAPSIGPRTAEHLSKVQIVTVKDLLDADSEAAANELNHRRIKPRTIREWQNQAMMVCRIPELRGHDAQILVACDVTTPEELAEYRPNDLFAIVAPFVDTSEGERIVRNGKKPDLEEVTFWIDCAKKSRTLKAA